LIQLENVSVHRGSTTVLDGISLAIGTEVVALVGPSGSGKSTLLRAVLGLEVPSRGTVRIGGRIMSLDGRERVRPEQRKVAMVFQDLALWPHLSVFGNLEFGLAAQRVDKRSRVARIERALSSVALADKGCRRPHELSGGERQRVAIARALVLDPVALMLDEPLTSLDVVTKEDMLTLFGRLFSERELPVAYVTHDPREAARLGERIIVLEAGRITQQGTLGDLDHAPATPFVRAFLRALE
jgi:ABC-type Fe3+/spermidine/putrescine transport system ATPase subunit